MECHGQATSGLYERACSLDVHATIGIEHASHDPGDAHRSGELDIANHRVEFSRRVDEIAGTGANQHEHRKSYPLDDGGDQASVRRRTTFAQVVAQLDPIRSSALGGKRRLESFDCRFNQRQPTSTNVQ